MLPAFAAGVCLYAGLYFSFGLIALAVAAAALILLFAHTRQAWRAGRDGRGPRCSSGPPSRTWRSGSGSGTTRWPSSAFGMAAHQAFKFPQWGFGHTLYFGALNLVEFALWCGPALALLCAAQLYRSCRSWAADGPGGPAGAGPGRHPGRAWFSSVAPAAETARLWLFLLPRLSPAPAPGSSVKSPPAAAPGFLLMLQLVTVLVVKKFQDLF